LILSDSNLAIGKPDEGMGREARRQGDKETGGWGEKY